MPPMKRFPDHSLYELRQSAMHPSSLDTTTMAEVLREISDREHEAECEIAAVSALRERNRRT